MDINNVLRTNSLNLNQQYFVLRRIKTNKYCRYKTQICNNVLLNRKCSRKHCRFAHHPNELVAPMCAFNDCINMYSNDKRCHFLHSNETVEMCKARIGRDYIGEIDWLLEYKKALEK